MATFNETIDKELKKLGWEKYNPDKASEETKRIRRERNRDNF